VDGRIRGTRNRAFGPADGLEIREARELEVAETAVALARLDQALANRLVRVPVARLQLEERLEEFGLDNLVAVELQDADAIARALIDRDVQLHPAGFLVGGVFEDLDLGLADARANVALVAVVLDDLFS